MTTLYKINIRRSAEKEIRLLPNAARDAVIRHIQALAHDPRPHGSQKLSGRHAYRIRVGVYRVVYTIVDRELIVEVIGVAHRREVYR